MKVRIISGIAMLPLLFVVMLGGYYLMGLVAIISGFALYELFNSLKKMGLKPALYESYGLLLILYVFAIFTFTVFDYMLWIILVHIVLFLMLFIKDKYSLQDIFMSIVGLTYVGFFSLHIILVDSLPQFNYVWFVIISAFATDIGAYFSGYFFGKHKLCPNISPKKTIEGALGGILSSMIGCLIVGIIFGKAMIIHSLVIGLIASVFAQLGDLTASVFKRKIDIKDYGNLIPGHGGVLDRIDSILYTAPVVFYYVMFVMSFDLI